MMIERIKNLWASLRPTPATDDLMSWLKHQREVKMESFPAFNGQTIHIITNTNVTASSPNFDEAVRECRAHLCRSRKPDGVRFTLPDGRILA